MASVQSGLTYPAWALLLLAAALSLAWGLLVAI
jgi:hypothetical protein